MSATVHIAPSIRSRQGDTLDSICHRHYGDTDLLEAVAELNPHTLQAPLLPAGLLIALPMLSESAAPTSTPNTIHLWGRSDA